MKYIIGLLLISLTTTTYGQGQELEVRGFGRIKTQPDLGVLHIELTTIQKEFGATVSALEADYDKIVKHLEKEGFKKEDIKTNNYGVRENRVYRRQMSYDSGFVGNQALTIEFQNTKENLSKITDSFTKSPVKAKFSFSFTISDNKREQLRNELIKKAIEDAKQKAKLIAETSGQQLGKIKLIKYGTYPTNNYDYVSEDLNLKFDVEVTDEENIRKEIGFDVKEISFRDHVIIVYELK